MDILPPFLSCIDCTAANNITLVYNRAAILLISVGMMSVIHSLGFCCTFVFLLTCMSVESRCLVGVQLNLLFFCNDQQRRAEISFISYPCVSGSMILVEV